MHLYRFNQNEEEDEEVDENMEWISLIPRKNVKMLNLFWVDKRMLFSTAFR